MYLTIIFTGLYYTFLQRKVIFIGAIGKKLRKTKSYQKLTIKNKNKYLCRYNEYL